MARMFPARAGMSRVQGSNVRRRDNVPRASGDEPVKDQEVTAPTACSPRERG